MRKDSGFGIQESGAPRAIAGDESLARSPGGADMAQSDLPANRLAHIAPTAMEAPPSPVAPGKTVGGRGSRLREVCADVTKLEPEWRELAEQLIVDGSTFEDVAEIFKEREGPRITLHALGVYYQSNLDLQKRRIKHRIELADKLKNAMAHPESTESRLADATLFTGLVSLSRRHAQLTVKDAQSLRLQRGNLQLRQRVLKMKLAQAVREKSIAHQRYLFEEARRQKLTLQNQQLEEILKKLRQDQSLPADVMGKIQEIYGIVREPYIPPKLAEQLRQPETL